MDGSSGLESEVKLLSDVVADKVILFLMVDELQLTSEIYHITAHIVIIFYLVKDHLSLRSCQDCLVVLLSALLGLVPGIGLGEVSIGLDEETVVLVLSQWFCIEIEPRAYCFFLDGESFIVLSALYGVGTV